MCLKCISHTLVQHGKIYPTPSHWQSTRMSKETTWFIDISNGLLLAFTILTRVIHLVIFGVAVDHADCFMTSQFTSWLGTNWPTKPSGDLSITFSHFCLVSAFLFIKSVLIGIYRRVNHHHDSSDQSECWLALSGREGFLAHNFVGVILSQRCNDMAQHNQPGKEHCALGRNCSNAFYCFMIKGNARKKWSTQSLYD